MNSHRNGITAAGNWIVDHIKTIDKYPSQDALVHIRGEKYSNGGSPYNVLKNLSMMGATFPLKGIGLLGDDDYAAEIKRDCAALGIDASSLKTFAGTPTSYTDVMAVESTGRRTFFHQSGASGFLDVSHFDFSGSTEKIFHLGYLLLLQSLDEIDANGLTGASIVLQKACEAGAKTSVDLVSEDSNRFSSVVSPSLPFIHFLFLNEFEASRCTGIYIDNDDPAFEDLSQCADYLLDAGVREWVFIHFPQGVFGKSKDGTINIQGAVKLPAEKIVGALGAGDALAAGILYALHESWNISNALELGVCCAASCLQRLSCSEGIVPFEEALLLGKKYGFIHLADKMRHRSPIEYKS